MASLQKTVTVRLIAEIEPTAEEATAGNEPVRFGGELHFKKGTSMRDIEKGLGDAASSMIEMMTARNLFTKLELL